MVKGPDCQPGRDSLKKRVCVITGCNTGIGYETALALARGGSTIIFACRSEERARGAMRKLLETDASVSEEQLVFLQLDTSSLKSVRTFAERFAESGFDGLHLLILNAGVMLRHRDLSVDGFEMTLASNHFGHFLLTHLLMPHLLKTEAKGEQPRIIVVGSTQHFKHDVFDFSEFVAIKGEQDKNVFMQKPYELFRAYGQSKIANQLFTEELARRLKSQGSKIPVNSLHPGEVHTEVARNMHPILIVLLRIFNSVLFLFLKTAQQGCTCTVYVATAPHLATSDETTGGFFLRHKNVESNALCRQQTVRDQFWKESVRLTGAPAF